MRSLKGEAPEFRLFYVDPDGPKGTATYRGEVLWTPEHPVKPKFINANHFDVVSPLTDNRAYHFMTPGNLNTTGAEAR